MDEEVERFDTYGDREALSDWAERYVEQYIYYKDLHEDCRDADTILSTYCDPVEQSDWAERCFEKYIEYKDMHEDWRDVQQDIDVAYCPEDKLDCDNDDYNCPSDDDYIYGGKLFSDDDSDY